MSNPSVIVTGLGRCGLSLVMQMLDAGGFPVVGEYPAYEVCQVGYPIGAHLRPGKALKVVDPQNNYFPPSKKNDMIGVLLERDYIEQARSQIKLLLATGVQVRSDVESLTKLAKSNRKDTEANRCRMGQWTRKRLLVLQFEDIIGRPQEAADHLNAFLADGKLDASKMAAQVRQRTARCLDVLLELDLIRDAGLRPR